MRYSFPRGCRAYCFHGAGLLGRFFLCAVSVWSSVCHRRKNPSGKKLTSVNFPSDFIMSLSPCQEIFSYTVNFSPRPSAPLTPPFFHVCQVFFRISSSNFLSSFCQEIFCQIQIFSFLIFKNVKKFLRSKLDRSRFRGFVKRFFHLSSSRNAAPVFHPCQEIFSQKQHEKTSCYSRSIGV